MITLEPFTKSDFQRLISWIDNAESLTEFAGASFQYPLTIVQLEKYISDEQKIIFRVRETKTGKIIGHAEIFRVEENMVRLCRVLIGEKEFRGRGLGQNLMMELLDYSFRSSEIERVELNVYERNIPALRCYQKVGFRRNPSGDKVTRINDQDWNSLNMIMSRGAWKKKSGK